MDPWTLTAQRLPFLLPKRPSHSTWTSLFPDASPDGVFGTHRHNRSCGGSASAVNNNGGNVVLTAGDKRSAPETITRILGLGRTAQDVFNRLALNHTGQTIRAEQHTVTRVEFLRGYVRQCRHRHSHKTGQPAAGVVNPRFLGGYLVPAFQNPNHGMVFRECRTKNVRKPASSSTHRA